jgi:hypothetical protein
VSAVALDNRIDFETKRSQMRRGVLVNLEKLIDEGFCFRAFGHIKDQT